MPIQYKLRLRENHTYSAKDTLQGAVDYAGSVFDLNEGQRKQLARDGVLVLSDGSILDVVALTQD